MTRTRFTGLLATLLGGGLLWAQAGCTRPQADPPPPPEKQENLMQKYNKGKK